MLVHARIKLELSSNMNYKTVAMPTLYPVGADSLA